MMNTTIIISTKMNLKEEIKSIRAYEAKIKELDELKKEKVAKIKKLMDKTGVETLSVAGFVVRYTKFVKNQFDTSLFKKLHLATCYGKDYELTPDFIKSIKGVC